MTPLPQARTLLICALGGEGGGVLTEWLVEAARHAGYPAQSTSIPGVAQRTGATTYYLEVLPVPQAELGGLRPVLSLSPVAGEIDLLVSSELLETARQIGNGMSSPQRTCVISATNRSLTTQERMQPGDGRADAKQLAEVVRQFSREHQILDMAALAREHGTVVSAVMLGAIAASGVLPFGREACEAAIAGGAAEPGPAARASLRGFAAAFEAVQRAREQTAVVTAMLADEADASPGPASPAELPPDVAAQFPASVHAVLTLGVARLRDYQGAAYARLYLERLREVLMAERSADPTAERDHAITREAARWLALWMAFDDIVRVADLKSRETRWLRVKREVKAKDGDLVRLYDHFKPGIAEFAGLLPPGLARRLLAWDQARSARGLAPWSLPLKIASHGPLGLMALRGLAALKGLRPRSSRYAAEQALISTWITALVAGTRRDWRLGHELAQCGRLIKGYGATNERGKDNLLHLVSHLTHMDDANAAAQAVAAARAAALADDAGRALDASLRQHGAPARPVKPQPIRWMRKPAQRSAQQA